MNSPDAITRLNAALDGRYQIDRKVGEGGMATVFLATDVKHKRPVALKVLKPELAAVVGAERFLAEIETTANLQHPHILPLFDSGQADGFLFYVMPFLEGETLHERIERERQLPVEEAVKIAQSVLSALQHAHDRGVIHRDIKPSNILMQDGQPVVSDFGIALAVGSAGGTRLTETGLSLGTPYYMSPEQATGDQVVGPSTDIFALSCVLYEMLVGEPPYPGKTAQAVLGKIIQGAPVSATAIRKSIPANVDAAIRCALEKLPADRFAGASDFGKALADPGFRHGAASSSDAAGQARGHALTAVFAVLAVVFAGTTIWALSDSEPPPTVERFGSPFLVGQEPLGTGPANFTLSPDGSAAVYMGPVGEGQTGGQLWVRRWSDLEATPIRGTEGGVQPDISPDGSEVAFARGAEIHVVPLGSGPARTLGRGTWPQWLEDGRIVAALGAVGLVAYSAAGADTVARLQGSDQNYLISDGLPGGGALGSVGLAEGGVEIRAFDLETGETRYLANGVFPQYVATGHLVYTFEGSLLAAPFDPEAMEITGPTVSIQGDIGFLRVSRSGRLLYTTGGQGQALREMVWVTREGVATAIDSTWTFTRGDVNVSWSLSPDDTRLALREQTDGVYDIWIKELDDGPRSRLTFDDRGDYFPEWTPDGQSVTYVSGPITKLEVYQRRADGTGEPAQPVAVEQSVALAFWHPDNEWLVLRTTTGAGNVFGRDILGMRPGVDTVPVPLMTEEYDESWPALSPDGRWIAYQSNETGRYEVYVRPFPDVGSGRWQISTQGGTVPRWAHSGREIFFRDANANMVSAQVDGSETAFRVVGTDIMFAVPQGFDQRGQPEGMPFDVTSDDQRFVMARVFQPDAQGGSATPSYVLVQNFGELLRTLVPN